VRRVGLGQERPEDLHDALDSAQGEAVGVGAAHSHRRSTHGQCLDDVGARAHAGIEQDGRPARGLNHLR
jgi:hypothetical protein